MEQIQRRIPRIARWHAGSGAALAGSIQLPLFVLSLVLYTTAAISSDLTFALAGVTCLFCANTIYGFMKLRDRLLFLFLHAGIFLFLLTRPLFCGAFPDRTWFLETIDATWFALDALFVSMLFLFFGCAFYAAVTRRNDRARARRSSEGGAVALVPSWRRRPSDFEGAQFAAATRTDAAAEIGARRVSALAKRAANLTVLGSVPSADEARKRRIKALRVAAFLCYLVCFVGACADGAIKMSYMSGLPYEQYYLIDSSQYIPGWIDYLYCMTPFMLCAYLATMPKKRPATLALVLYVVQTVPMLKIGSRSDFVIAFLFLLLYFAFRAVISKDEVWVSRRLVVFLLVAIPVLVFAMGVMNYTREVEGGRPEYTALQQIADALYKQGVSFTVLGHGYMVNNEIQELGFKFYSIGDLITTFTQGFIGQTLFGFTLLPSTNSPELALYGNSYAHAMSFFAHPNYLGGEGYGSSYILELYADFGFAGIALGSFLISVALVALTRSIGRSWFWGTCALIGSLSVFHMARGYACEWISFIWSTRFWVAIVLLLVVTAVLELTMRAGWTEKLARAFDGAAHVARIPLGGYATVAHGVTDAFACPGDEPSSPTDAALRAKHAKASGRSPGAADVRISRYGLPVYETAQIKRG